MNRISFFEGKRKEMKKKKEVNVVKGSGEQNLQNFVFSKAWDTKVSNDSMLPQDLINRG